MLRINDLTVRHSPDTPVLRSASMVLPPHGVHAVIGPNSAGKTTLLHTIAGHLRPTAGHIVLDGHDITGIRPTRAARTGIALAPQGRRLWPSLTVHEHLTITRPTTRKQDRGQSWNLDQLLDLFPELAARLRHRAHQLSGGEQQMLTIARALRLAPRLLLCDEPTEGLAPTAATRIRTALAGLPRYGVTVLIALPQARVATALAHTVHVLTSGRISPALDPDTDDVDTLIRRHLGLTTAQPPSGPRSPIAVAADHQPPTHSQCPSSRDDS
ncbi:ABC transporter ATP-binding protein [Micromonospora carbonacea]|uniref:ABC transporter ATP-binding protein n=1 Tax=Micromonospora carbonacea TaxID=47853 RepID=UPI0034024D0B